jgi:hypothetical protein
MKIAHPCGANTIHHDGELYQAGEDGFFDVPDKVFSALAPHGFVKPEDLPRKGGKGKGAAPADPNAKPENQ